MSVTITTNELVSNPITLFLWEKRFTTLSLYARSKGLSPTSVRNTFYGIRPIRKVVLFLYENDREIFNMLPDCSKSKVLDYGLAV